MKKQVVVLSAAAAVITAGALSLVSKSANADADNHSDKEKCYGIVKAGKNDCGSAHHSCAGMAKEDSSASDWVFVPKGLCAKLVNGSTEAGE